MLPARVALALQADGWWLRSDIIWAKPNPMPESVTDRPTSAHEHVFLLTKSARYFYDAEAVQEASIYPDDNRKARSSSGQKRLPTERIAGIREGSATYPARNRRNVWTIASQPYTEAHFATFPPKLVEPCILAGTSARGCCPACGAGWERVVEREAGESGQSLLRPKGTLAAKHNQGGHGTKKSTLSISGGSSGWEKIGTKSTTAGWRPTCDCPPADPVPAIVLDPFFGSGTVGAVAVETGRHYVGIELNEEYINLARRRIGAAQPALIAKGLE